MPLSKSSYLFLFHKFMAYVPPLGYKLHEGMCFVYLVYCCSLSAWPHNIIWYSLICGWLGWRKSGPVESTIKKAYRLSDSGSGRIPNYFYLHLPAAASSSHPHLTSLRLLLHFLFTATCFSRQLNEQYYGRLIFWNANHSGFFFSPFISSLLLCPWSKLKT